ncbi:MAG TPA: hypothetical protein VMN57_16630 [Anaerolineales bacterium]|nr:hypothetical protein [Anaerolineales bacterium]
MQPLTHPQARDRVEKAQTGLLSAADLADLKAHLETCRDCRNYQARFRADEAALRLALARDLRREEPDPGAVLKTIARIRSRLRTRRALILAGGAVRTLSLAGFAVGVAIGLNWVFTTFSQATTEPAAPEVDTTAAPEIQEAVGPAPGPTAVAGSGDPSLPFQEPTPVPVLGYTPNSLQLRLTLGVSLAAVQSVVFSPDSETVAAAYDDGFVRIWRVRDGALLTQIEAHIKWVTVLAFSPDGSLLATSGRDGAVKLWFAGSGGFFKTVYASEAIVEAVQFSSNGELLAVTLDNFSVALVRIKDGSLTAILPSAVHLAVNTDEGRNKTLTVSGETAIWLDAENPAPLGLNVVGQNSRSAPAVVSADGTLLATAQTEGLIDLWRIVDIIIVEEDYDHRGNDLITRFISGSLLFKLAGHSRWANQLDFSADGRYLVSASEDRTVIQWSLADGSPVEILTGHDGPVNTVDVSPDDQWIASGSDDGTVRIWMLTETK